jgi:hypothetical protein
MNRYIKQRQLEEQQRDEIIKIKAIKYKRIGYDDNRDHNESSEKPQVTHKNKTYKNIRVNNRKKNMTYKS